MKNVVAAPPHVEYDAHDSDVTFTRDAEPGGVTAAGLHIGGQCVSRLRIVPFTIRIGLAAVRVDGISAVRTDEAHRGRGYGRRLMEAAIRRMRAGDAALSMLYGIPHFYLKFGYAAAGPEYRIVLTHLDEPAELPRGWEVRRFVPRDLPLVLDLYERATAAACGAAVRGETAPAWEHLLGRPAGVVSECRIVEEPTGRAAAYVWRLTRSPAAFGEGGGGDAEALVFSEVVAADVPSARAALAACRRWAADVSATMDQPLKRVVLAAPPDSPLAVAAAFQHAQLTATCYPASGSMARVLDVGRLLRAVTPELRARTAARTAAHVSSFPAATPVRVWLRTDLADATLTLGPASARVESGAPATERADVLAVSLPQAALARLALGAYPPGAVLDQLDRPPSEAARGLIEALFPQRHPHMYFPDRY